MEKLKGLLVSNQSVFSMFKFDLGLTNLVQHKIDTKDDGLSHSRTGIFVYGLWFV
jgi:hypothetical protein